MTTKQGGYAGVLGMPKHATSFEPIDPEHDLGPYKAGHEIHNTGSISASLEDGYVVEPGIQKVPLKHFYGGERPKLAGSSDDVRRTKHLAEQIKKSKRLDPLIVAIDEEGPYVLEGGHRLDASYLLNGTHIPAMVVRHAGVPLFKK